MFDFIPQGQVTGIGSLPHTNPDEAIRFVAELSPTIPFWPQLPQREPEEMMVTQVLLPLLDLLEQNGPARFDVKKDAIAPFRSRLRETPSCLDTQGAAGFFAFEHACEANIFTQANALKGQMIGPITLAHSLYMNERVLAGYPEIHAEITGYLCRLGLWQIHRLQKFGKPILLFLDEPIFWSHTSRSYLLDNLRQLINALRSAGAYIGIHCCSPESPAAICSVQPDIISFDACQQFESFLAYPQIHTFIKAGGWVAFGLIPTLGKFDHSALMETWMRWVAVTQGNDNLTRLTAQSLITASCGLGLLPVKDAQSIFEKCHELSKLIVTAGEFTKG